MDLEIPFPIGGRDDSVTRSHQPPNTTTESENVRAKVPWTGAIGGSSRCGTDKFCSVSLGMGRVQELAHTVFDAGHVTYTALDQPTIDWEAAGPSGKSAFANAYDRYGNHYVLDGGSAVLVYNTSGKLTATISPTLQAGQVCRALCVDDLRRVYIGVSEGSTQARARVFSYANDPYTGWVQQWELNCEGYVEKIAVFGDRLFALVNDAAAGKAYVAAFFMPVGLAPESVWRQKIFAPGNVLAVSSKGDIAVGSGINPNRGLDPRVPGTGQILDDEFASWRWNDLAEWSKRKWNDFDPRALGADDGAALTELADVNGSQRIARVSTTPVVLTDIQCQLACTAANVTGGSTFVISEADGTGAYTYTFVTPALTPLPGEVLIGANLNATFTNLKDAMTSGGNGTTSALGTEPAVGVIPGTIGANLPMQCATSHEIRKLTSSGNLRFYLGFDQASNTVRYILSGKTVTPTAPTFKKLGAAGQPCVSFDGKANKMETLVNASSAIAGAEQESTLLPSYGSAGVLASSARFVMFMVFKAYPDTAPACIFSQPNAIWQRRVVVNRGSGSSTTLSAGNLCVVEHVNAGADQFHGASYQTGDTQNLSILCIVSNPTGNYEVYLNGTSIGSGVAAANDGIGPSFLGQHTTLGPLSTTFEQRFAHFELYRFMVSREYVDSGGSTALISTSERQYWEGALAWQHGAQGSLPQGSAIASTFVTDSNSYGDFTSTAVGNKLLRTAHGLAANLAVRLYGALPLGLAYNVTYYVVNPNADDLQLSLSIGGPAVTVGTTGTAFELRELPLSTIRLTAHGLLDDDPVVVTTAGNGIPDGLTYTDTYYVVNATADTLQLALSIGGTPVAFADLYDDFPSPGTPFDFELRTPPHPFALVPPPPVGGLASDWHLARQAMSTLPTVMKLDRLTGEIAAVEASDGSTNNTSGIGYGVAWNKDGTKLYTCGIPITLAEPYSVRALVDKGDHFSKDPADGAWTASVGEETGGASFVESFTYDRLQLAVDSFDNLYVPFFNERFAGAPKFYWLFDKDGNLLADPDNATAQCAYSVAVDPIVPSYDGNATTVDRARRVGLATRAEAQLALGFSAQPDDLSQLFVTGLLTPSSAPSTETFTMVAAAPASSLELQIGSAVDDTLMKIRDGLIAHRLLAGAERTLVPTTLTASSLVLVARIAQTTTAVAGTTSPAFNGTFTPADFTPSGSTVFQLLAVSSANNGLGLQHAIVAVCEGVAQLITPSSAIPATAIGGAVLDPDAKYMHAASLFGQVFIVDGQNACVMDARTRELRKYEATDDGRVPENCRIVETYAGGVMLFAGPDGHNWFLSRRPRPYEWNYNPPVQTDTQAWNGDLGPPGRLPDVANGFFALFDDIGFFGGDHTVHRLTGDPAANGRFDPISNIVGMAFGRAWAIGPSNTPFFWAQQGGLYTIVGGTSVAPVSDRKLDYSLQKIDLERFYVRMAWNWLLDGLDIYLCPFNGVDESPQTWFWERATNAFQPDTRSDSSRDVTALAVVKSDLITERLTLLGRRDGYVSKYNPLSETDDGKVINSRVVIGPFQANGRMETVLNHLLVTLDQTAGHARVNIYTSQTAQTKGALVRSYTLSPGMNRPLAARCRGGYLWIEIQSQRRWAFDRLLAVLDVGSLRRQRAR